MRQRALSRISRSPLPNQIFDTRSVLLFAVIAVGSAMAMHAQAADGAVTLAPPAAVNPANQPPAMAQSTDAPPLLTSPAFVPRQHADQHTGAANDPDKRPEITATEPTALLPPKSAARKAARGLTIPATRPTSGPAATEPTEAK